MKSRLFKGVAAYGFGQIVTLAIQLANVPAFLHYWGQDTFGEWLLLATIPLYLAMSDLGLGTVAANELTLRVSSDDMEGARGLYGSTWVTVSLISASFILLAIAIVAALPVGSLLRMRVIDHGAVSAALVLLVIQVAINQQVAVLNAGYRATGLYARGVTLSNVARLAVFGSGLCSLSLGADAVGYASATLCATIAAFLATCIDFRAKVPSLYPRPSRRGFAELKPLIWPALSLNILPLGNAVSLQGMVAVVAFQLGPAAVVTFTTLRTLSRFITQLTTAVSTTTWPEFSILIGKKDLEGAVKLYRRASRLVLWVSIVLGIVMLPISETLLNLWTASKVQFDFPLILFLVLSSMLNSVWSVSGAVSLAVNRHAPMAIAVLFGAFVSLLIGILLSPTVGLFGIGLAVLIGELLVTMTSLPLASRILKDSLRKHLDYVLIPPIDETRRLIHRITRRSKPT